MTDYSAEVAVSAASNSDEALIGGRRVQVDGLRALAMFGVLYVHYTDASPLTEDLRVSLFFVVSGYLITFILWTAKQRGGQINVLNFYARRALRLLPALWVMILVAAALNVDGARHEAVWHMFQLSNVRFAMNGDMTPWVFAQLWSLNVLEQFYILWPLVILFLPLRWIYVVTFAIIFSMHVLHEHQDEIGLADDWDYLVLSWDPIAFGVLAFLLQQIEAASEMLTSSGAKILALIAIASPYFLWEGFGDSTTYRLLSCMGLAVLVLGAFKGYGGILGWLLGCGVARFISKISYGVYIYHMLAWAIMMHWFSALEATSFTTFLVMSAVTMSISTLSWYAMEQPINRLKAYFPTTSRL